MRSTRTIRWLLLLCFLTSMPLTLVNSHDIGWLADGDNWQGWEITIGWGLFLIWFAPFHFVPILLASTMMVITPFLDYRSLGPTARRIVVFWSIGAMMSVPMIALGWSDAGIYPTFGLWAGPILVLGIMNVAQSASPVA